MNIWPLEWGLRRGLPGKLTGKKRGKSKAFMPWQPLKISNQVSHRYKQFSQPLPMENRREREKNYRIERWMSNAFEFLIFFSSVLFFARSSFEFNCTGTQTFASSSSTQLKWFNSAAIRKVFACACTQCIYLPLEYLPYAIIIIIEVIAPILKIGNKNKKRRRACLIWVFVCTWNEIHHWIIEIT